MRNKRLFEKLVRKDQIQLKSWLYQQLINYGYDPVFEKGFLYAPGDIPVMVIAHLDTVHKEQVKQVCWDNGYNTAMSPQGIGGDDRCGVYMVLRLIKDLKCHVLFCEDEEVGGVGARKFTASDTMPQVNFLVEFDRKGNNDAVFYDCANYDFVAMVESYGFKEDYGSFSDISIIAPHLKVAAVNISSGYYNAHTKHECINMAEMNENVTRVAQLIQENKDDFYEYVEDKSYRYKGWHTYYSSGKGYEDDGWYDGYGNYYGYGCYNDYGFGNSTKTGTGYDRIHIMPLPAKDLIVMDVESEYPLSAQDAPFFGMDEYGNLFIREYDDTWSFVSSDCNVYEDTDDMKWVDYDGTKAQFAQVDWFPEEQDEDKPWTEEKEVTTV